jgi:hypothetical protein
VPLYSEKAMRLIKKSRFDGSQNGATRRGVEVPYIKPIISESHGEKPVKFLKNMR